jgi:hypothetical protein
MLKLSTYTLTIVIVNVEINIQGLKRVDAINIALNSSKLRSQFASIVIINQQLSLLKIQSFINGLRILISTITLFENNSNAIR